MKVISRVKPLVFDGCEDGKITIQYTNLGDPFREGLSFSMEDEYGYASVMLQSYELKELYDHIGKHLGLTAS